MACVVLYALGRLVLISMNLLDPLSRFSMSICPSETLFFNYQEREEQQKLFTPWLIETAANKGDE